MLTLDDLPLQIAAPCGPDNYQKLHAREMDQSLDFWNMMAYDFGKQQGFTAPHLGFHSPPPMSFLYSWFLGQGRRSPSERLRRAN